MMKRIFAKIFGVTEPPTTAAAARQQTLPVEYLPEHRLTATELAGGVGPNGECWEPWRTEHNSGLRWFKRISAAELQPVAPMVHGFSEVENHEFTGDEFHANDIDDSARDFELGDCDDDRDFRL